MQYYTYIQQQKVKNLEAIIRENIEVGFQLKVLFLVENTCIDGLINPSVENLYSAILYVYPATKG